MLVRTLALMLATVGLLVPAQAPATATPDHFTPRPGPTFNNPVGGASKRRAIYRRIIRSTNSSPHGSNISIFSWNFLTQGGTDALLRAQRRGVRVRLIMDDRNVTEIDNPPFRRLRRELRQHNHRHHLRPGRRSWARLCHGTCRGHKGSAHSKFFMFSRVGRARRVVMQGSANFTLAAGNNQWNDIYTHAGHRKVWRFASKIFRQAAHDRPVRRPYANRSFKGFRLMMFPNTGRKSPDPVMGLLRRVRCKGARNTGSGRTVIRIAPDVIRHDRGMRLARRVRFLWRHGCDVKIGYTVVGIKIGRMLRDRSHRRGPVPMKHLVQDFNGDGEFDNYFHLKAMTIAGNYGGSRRGLVLLNGSSNWSGLGGRSDENLGIYTLRNRVRRYQKHLEYWYKNFPSDGRSASSARRVAGGEPQLVFGSGKDAVYENGESVTNGEYDPFASMPRD